MPDEKITESLDEDGSPNPESAGLTMKVSQKIQQDRRKGQSAKEQTLARVKEFLGNVICEAAYKGQLDVVDMLLEKGADINFRSPKFGNSSPLEIAVKEGHYKLVAQLLHKGTSKFNMERLEDLLFVCIERGCENFVDLLVSKYPDINKPSTISGDTPLQRAAFFGNEALIAKFLERGAKINGLSLNRDTNALIRAIQGGHQSAARLLVERGANIHKKVHAKLAFHDSALRLACFKGQRETVELLLSRKANIAKIGRRGDALYAASASGKADIVQLLLNRGVDVNTRRPSDGTTPLSIASWHGHLEVVKLLLEGNATVEPQRYGPIIYESPLWMACQAGNEAVVNLLLEYGAKVSYENVTDDDTLAIASRNGHKETVKILLEHIAGVPGLEANCTRALDLASSYGHWEVVNLLFDYDANVNGCNGKYTILVDAVYGGNEDTVRLLLDRGADVNADCHCIAHQLNTVTPLQTAIMSDGNVPIVKLLLSKGADVNAGLPYGGNSVPLSMTIRNFQPRILRILLEHGADIDVLRNQIAFDKHEMELESAICQGPPKIAAVLIEMAIDSSDDPEHARRCWNEAFKDLGERERKRY